MTQKLLRLVYVFEFLIAVIAIFTAWSEIGGQAALDLMHWGWKLGLGTALAFAIVAYTAAAVASDNIWNLRSARWLTIMVVLMLVIGVVTYYYALLADTTDTEEGSAISLVRTLIASSSVYS